MNSTPRCSLVGGNLRGARQVFHVALLQQLQVVVHNQRRHLHAAPALFQLRLRPRLRNAIADSSSDSRRFCRTDGQTRAAGPQSGSAGTRAGPWRQRRPGRDAAPVDGPANQIKLQRANSSVGLLLLDLVVFCAAWHERCGQLFFTGGQVTVFIQIADHELAQRHGVGGSRLRAPNCHAR